MSVTLSMAMLVHDCGARLHSLIADARRWADEVVLGVDDSSDPLTMDLAHRLGDVVFQWGHTPLVDTFRMELIHHATSEWVCILDDDERWGVEVEAMRQMLETRTYTHYWLARCWVMRLDPLQYADEMPWWPDWQLRVIKRSAQSISHSAALHSLYEVSGMSHYLMEWPIWHYDRVVRTTQEREAKIARYRDQGMAPGTMLERYYVGVPERLAPLPPEAYPEAPLLPEKLWPT